MTATIQETPTLNTDDDSCILVEVVEDTRAYLGDWIPRAQLVKAVGYALGYAEQLGRLGKPTGNDDSLRQRAEAAVNEAIASDDMICHGELCCTTWRKREPYAWLYEPPKRPS